jgi:hypothetical protein
MDLDLTIQGAPNFRAPDEEGLNVYGVAQPTVPGLKSILTILGCQPHPRTAARRGSSVVNRGVDGIPLSKSVSQPSHGKGNSEDIEDSAEGDAIWFSTREETLSEFCLYSPRYCADIE